MLHTDPETKHLEWNNIALWRIWRISYKLSSCWQRQPNTSNPNLIWAVQQNHREFNLSRSDLNHICRWFENAAQYIRIGFHVGFFVCLFSQSPHNSLTSHCNRKKTGREQIFPGFGSNHVKPKLASALCIHTNSLTSHQLQCQHPPPTTTEASSQSLHSLKSNSPPLPTYMHHPTPLHTTPYMWRAGERRGEGKREEERRRGGAQWGAYRGEVGLQRQLSDDLNPLSLSISLSPSIHPPTPLPNVGYPSHCLTAVCQTILLSLLWGTGWTPSRWAATVTTLSTLDLLPLTSWPRWQQSEWRAN